MYVKIKICNKWISKKHMLFMYVKYANVHEKYTV